jgi:hypothetical protein
MSDPTKFPQMHIAESAMNRIMNMKAELLPLTNLELPKSDEGGQLQMPSQQTGAQVQDTIGTTPAVEPNAAEPALQGAELDQQLAMGVGGSAGGAAPAAAAGGDIAAAGAGAGALGAGAAGAGAGAAGAAVAGEAVASGAELLPLLLV